MKNSRDQARGWIEVLARQEAIPFAPLLPRHLEAGAITRLCDCGCNSFDQSVPERSDLEPITHPGASGGAFFEAVYELNSEEQIAFLFFSDARGNLSGIDITLGGGNHRPLPEDVRVGGLLYTTWLRSNNSVEGDAAKPRASR